MVLFFNPSGENMYGSLGETLEIWSLHKNEHGGLGRNGISFPAMTI